MECKFNQQELEKIREWVYGHKEELKEDLRRLVAVPSVSEPDSGEKPYGKECKKVLEEMMAIAASYGLTATNYEYHFAGMGLRPYVYGENAISVWNHLDVVAAGDGWTFPAYEMSEKDGFLIGRGIQDNKGPAAGALYALRYLKEEEERLGLRHNFVLFTGCSEERGMEDMEYFMSHYKMDGFQLVADCAFPLGHGEKGILNLTYEKQLEPDSLILGLSAGSSVNSIPGEAHIRLKKVPGLMEALQHLGKNGITVEEEPESLKVEALGIGGHVGFPEGSVHALYVLTEALQDLEFFQEEDRRLFQFLCRMNGDFHGKGAGIACEDELSGALCGALNIARYQEDGSKKYVWMQSDHRYPITGSAGAEIGERLVRLASLYGCKAVIKKDEKPYYLDPESDTVKTVMSAYRAVTGKDSRPFTMSGGTYARKLPNAVSYGMSLEKKRIYQDPKRPGASGDCHQPDESLDFSQLLEAVVIYIATLLALD